MKIDYEKAKISDHEELYHVMQISARELSRNAYNNQLRDIFDKFYTEKKPDYIRQTLKNQNNHTIVAKNNEKIVGFIQLNVHHKIGILNHLYILPGYEGNLIGTQLLNLAKERAVQLNITKLYTESTLNALSYYEKHGFINKGLIPDKSAYDLELELTDHCNKT